MKNFLLSISQALDISPRNNMRSTRAIIDFHKKLQEHDDGEALKKDMEKIGVDFYAALEKYRIEKPAV